MIISPVRFMVFLLLFILAAASVVSAQTPTATSGVTGAASSSADKSLQPKVIQPPKQNALQLSQDHPVINKIVDYGTAGGATLAALLDFLKSRSVIYQVRNTSRGAGFVTCESVGLWKAADGCGFRDVRYIVSYMTVITVMELLHSRIGVIADLVKSFLMISSLKGYEAGKATENSGPLIGTF